MNDRALSRKLIYLKKLEMTLPIFDKSIVFHVGEFFRHVGSFEVKVIGELLSVEGDIKLP